MTLRLRLIAAATCTLMASTAFAQSSDGTVPAAGAADGSEVIAKVGDRDVTRADLGAFASQLGEQLQRVPAEQRAAQALDAYVDMVLVSKLGEDAGLDQSDTYKRTLALARDRALQQAWFEGQAAAITDDEIKARYDLEIGKITPPEEVRARHILVKSEDEAKAIIAELDGGADFEELAKAKSTGPSGPKGGDLGFFGRGQMVPEFDKAVFELEAGGVTAAPVKTQFGYHVIKLEEKRTQPLPTLEASKERMRQFVLRDRFNEQVKTAREANAVTIIDESLKLPAQ